MKNPFFNFYAFLLIILSSCDSDNKDIFNNERVKIVGTINNTNENISLGDTLKIYVHVPDTIYNSFSSATIIHTLQLAHFNLRITKIDTLNKIPIFVDRSSYWTTIGKINSMNAWNFELNSTQKPYSVLINFKPIEKGIYYFEVSSQLGKLKVNNSYEPRLIVGFNVPDKHIHLAEPYFGSLWANDAAIREAGTYVFNVQ